MNTSLHSSLHYFFCHACSVHTEAREGCWVSCPIRVSHWAWSWTGSQQALVIPLSPSSTAPGLQVWVWPCLDFYMGSGIKTRFLCFYILQKTPEPIKLPPPHHSLLNMLTWVTTIVIVHPFRPMLYLPRRRHFPEEPQNKWLQRKVFHFQEMYHWENYLIDSLYLNFSICFQNVSISGSPIQLHPRLHIAFQPTAFCLV